MIFDVGNNGIRRQQKWQGIFYHNKPFLLKNDHKYDTII